MVPSIAVKHRADHQFTRTTFQNPYQLDTAIKIYKVQKLYNLRRTFCLPIWHSLARFVECNNGYIAAKIETKPSQNRRKMLNMSAFKRQQNAQNFLTKKPPIHCECYFEVLTKVCLLIFRQVLRQIP